MRPGPAPALPVLLAAAGLLVAACGSQTTAQTSAGAHEADLPSLQASGQRLALSCSGCHGGASDAIPDLYALEPGEMQSRLLAYKTDADGTTVMHRLMRGYSDEEIAALSAYFAPDVEEE